MCLFIYNVKMMGWGLLYMANGYVFGVCIGGCFDVDAYDGKWDV